MSPLGYAMIVILAILMTLSVARVGRSRNRLANERKLGPDGVRRAREMELVGYIRRGYLDDARQFAARHQLELPKDELRALADRQLATAGHRVDCVSFLGVSDALRTYQLAGVVPPASIVPLVARGLRQNEEFMDLAASIAVEACRTQPNFPQPELLSAADCLLARGKESGVHLIEQVGLTLSVAQLRMYGDALISSGYHAPARRVYEQAAALEAHGPTPTVSIARAS